MSLELAPGENKILEALKYGERERSKLKSFTKLLNETGLSGPALSEYLKRLQKKGYIKRDVDSRKYFNTVEANNALERLEIIEALMTRGEESKMQFRPLLEHEWIKDLNMAKGDSLTGVEAMNGLPVYFPPLKEAVTPYPNIQEVEYQGETWFLAKVMGVDGKKKPIILLPGDYVIYKQAPDRAIAMVKIEFKIEKRVP